MKNNFQTTQAENPSGVLIEETIPPLAKMNALLVDDSKTCTKIIAAHLHAYGLGYVHCASNGQEALDFLKQSYERINIIICDWVMPGIDGSELLMRIRALDSDIPFVMVTSLSNPDFVRQAKKDGVTDYIVKPIDFRLMHRKLYSIHNNMFEKQF